MSKIIISKVNGETFKKDVVLSKKDMFKNDGPTVFDFVGEVEKVSDDDEGLFNSLFRAIGASDLKINTLYELLIGIKEKSDFIPIVNALKNNYIKARLNSIDITRNTARINRVTNCVDEMLIKYPNYVMYEIIKRISAMYFHNYVYNMDKKDLNDLFSLIEDGIEIDEMFDNNDKLNVKEKNEVIYNASKLAFFRLLRQKYSIDRTHLCWECHIHTLDCPKMMDIEKKRIDEYDFITDGKQIYDNNELDEFNVYQCKKFIKSR
ncbi:MAG: hypothetical protein IJ565_06495 [Bacilli bacterium]|nr:hypothetical protein [Bacilli bacterium]